MPRGSRLRLGVFGNRHSTPSFPLAHELIRGKLREAIHRCCVLSMSQKVDPQKTSRILERALMRFAQSAIVAESLLCASALLGNRTMQGIKEKASSHGASVLTTAPTFRPFCLLVTLPGPLYLQKSAWVSYSLTSLGFLLH